jgi:hypothetical protein
MKNINTKKYSQIEENIEEDIYKPKRERRFRVTIYVDVWVPETDDLEADRMIAQSQVSEYADQIPNSYIGGVAFYDISKGLNPLDREI